MHRSLVFLYPAGKRMTRLTNDTLLQSLHGILYTTPFRSLVRMGVLWLNQDLAKRSVWSEPHLDTKDSLHWFRKALDIGQRGGRWFPQFFIFRLICLRYMLWWYWWEKGWSWSMNETLRVPFTYERCNHMWLLFGSFNDVGRQVPGASAAAEHAWQNHHHVDWEAAEVIDFSSDWYPRCLLESWHIHRKPDPMNRESGPLPQIYCTLLSEQKHK